MAKEKYKLCLYVAWQTQKSLKVIENLQNYCREHLAENYPIGIIDLRAHPHLVEGEQIIAARTLIKNCLIRCAFS
jgi:hypothetical protein